ncbi:hypothetical protein [Candidatus Poriferisocius sp.]|uniref:hypothetical protein n=1 Tax=Candidatus Poriferisocius sp. TaxID=3101276 RepID=UPI003B016E0A
MTSATNPHIKPANGMATAGFILSFFTLTPFVGFPIFVLSIVFCSIGLRRANVEGRQGKGLAIAGLVINIVMLLFAILIVIAILSESS